MATRYNHPKKTTLRSRGVSNAQSLAAEAEATLQRNDPVDMDLTGEVLDEIAQGRPTPFKRAIPGSVYIPRTGRTPK